MQKVFTSNESVTNIDLNFEKVLYRKKTLFNEPEEIYSIETKKGLKMSFDSKK